MNMQAKLVVPAERVRRRNAQTRPLNLVLQGAGAHGAFGWGILDKLLEDGRIDVSSIAATSFGAINAVIYAYGQLSGGKERARSLLASFWRTESSVSTGQVSCSPIPSTVGCTLGARWLESVTQILSPYEFNPLNLQPLRSTLESIVDFAELRRSRKTQIAICATHVRSGRPRTFTNRQITVDAVLASACQPSLSQAVEIEGEHYWDGVYSGLPSLATLLGNSQSRDILVGQISPIERRTLPRRAADIQARIGEIATHNSWLREVRALADAAKLLNNDWIKPEHKHQMSPVHLHAIRSDEVMSDLTLTAKFDNSRRFVTRLRDMGCHAAELWLETHFDAIGVRSTIELSQRHI